MAETDRELLEKAAKAAGIAVDWRESVRCLCYSSSPYNVAWNPITEDGDRYRLARTCKLIIDFDGGEVRWNFNGFGYSHCLKFTPGDEASEARAIVSAAAALAPGSDARNPSKGGA